MRREGHGEALAGLALLFGAAALLSLCAGAFSYAPARIVAMLADAIRGIPPAPADALDRNVFFQLRLPRVAMAALTGGALGLSGAVLQGLFRNPIVEPGLVGTSSGAALGSALVFVFGAPLIDRLHLPQPLLLPVFAFAGALAATGFAFRIASAWRRVHAYSLLLAGIAVNALCAAGTGWLSYVARDPQARNITFWSLGTFTTASLPAVAIVTPVFILGTALLLREARALDALMLGAEEAASLGVDPAALTRRVIVVQTLLVAVVTAHVGVIAFVGLVVPHLLRLTRSSSHSFLLPASALLGAALLEIVDVAARFAVRPAELPVGILTALVGAPVFLVLLVTARTRAEGGRHD